MVHLRFHGGERSLRSVVQLKGHGGVRNLRLRVVLGLRVLR